MLSTNPLHYNLPIRTQLRVIDTHHIAVVKLIKSRIIKKDALKVIEMANRIRQKDTDLVVSLVCTSAICSKSIQLLKQENIGIITEML